MEKQKQQGSYSQIDEDISYFKSLVKEIKLTCFQLINSLLKQDPFSVWFRLVLIIIQVFQIIHFHFDIMFIDLWQSPEVTNNLADLLGYLRGTPYLQNADFDAFSQVFYVIIGFISANFLLLLYIIFSLKVQGSQISWPITVFNLSIELMQTVLYVPMLEILMTAFRCRSSVNKLTGKEIFVHDFYNSTECFVGNYISYTLLAGICSFLLFVTLSIVSLLNFECRFVSPNCNNKKNARGDLTFLWYRTIIIICFTFMIEKGFEIILIAIITIGSSLFFIEFRYNLTNHNFWFAKLITVQYSINIWSCWVLILAQVTENYSFDGSIYVWLIGIPILVAIVLVQSELRLDYLLLDPNHYQFVNLAINQLTYLTQLIGLYNTDRSVTILLDGFLDFHRTHCNKEECPSKRRIMKTTQFSKMMRQLGESENLISLIATLQGMFYNATQQYPNSTTLRIIYSLYLLDIVQLKQQALQELINAQMENPAFDEQFIIFRYKTIIENQLVDNQGGSLDQKAATTTVPGGNSNSASNNSGNESGEVLNELSILNHINSCKHNIQRSANLQVEFWSQLSEDMPDLGQLSQLGFKINIVNSHAEEQYMKLMRITSEMPSIMRLYAQFLIHILNDKDGGMAILLKISDINNRQNQRKSANLIDVATESKPTVFISAEDDSFGLITQGNLAATGTLGYNQMEIANRNVKMIMPLMYARHHDNFLENYLSTLEPRLLNYERMLPAKTKLDYLISVSTIVRQVPSLIHGLQFVAQFQVHQSLNEQCQLLINIDGVIELISATCINLLGIDNQKINRKQIKITDAIENFFDRMEEFTSKYGGTCTVREFSQKKNQFPAQVFCECVSFRNVGDQGYNIKITRLKPDQQAGDNLLHVNLNEINNDTSMVSNNNNNNTITKRMKSQITKHMYFQYDVYNHQYIGEMKEGPPNNNMEANDTSIISNKIDVNDHVISIPFGNSRTPENPNENQIVSALTKSQVGMSGVIPPEDEQIDYGQYYNIKIVKWIQGVFRDSDEIQKEEMQNFTDDEDNESEKQKIKESKQTNEASVDSQKEKNEDNKINAERIFKKKSYFKQFIVENNFTESWTLNNAQYLGIFVITLFVAHSLINHFLISNRLSETKDRFQLISTSIKISSDWQRILSNFFDLRAIQSKVYNLEGQPENGEIDRLKKQIDDQILEIQDLLNYLQLNKKALNSNQQIMTEENVVPMKYLQNDDVLKYDLYSATEQLIFKSYDLQTIPNPDYQTEMRVIQYNLLNSYQLKWNSFSEYYITDLQSWNDEKYSIYIILNTVAGVAVFLFLVILIPCYRNIKNSQEQVLVTFLDIPLSRVQTLLGDCELFLTQLQSGSDEDIQSDRSHISLMDEQENLMTGMRLRGQRRRKHKISLKSQFGLLVPFLTTSLLFLSYMITSYVVSLYNSNNLQSFSEEFSNTAKAETFYIYCNNVLYSTMFDPEMPVKQNKVAFNYLDSSIAAMYDINSIIQKEHSQNLNIHDPLFLSTYADIFLDNQSCDILSQNYQVPTSDCQKFAEGIILEGVAVAIPSYIENIRNLLGMIQAADPTVQHSEFIKLQITTEINQMQTIYIQGLYRYLIDIFMESIVIKDDSCQATLVTILIIFIIFSLIMFLLLWIPIIGSIAREVHRIRSMILMVPLELFQDTQSLRTLLQPYLMKRYQD